MKTVSDKPFPGRSFVSCCKRFTESLPPCRGLFEVQVSGGG